MSMDADKKTIVIFASMTSQVKTTTKTPENIKGRSVNVPRYQKLKSLSSKYNVYVMGQVRHELIPLMSAVKLCPGRGYYLFLLIYPFWALWELYRLGKREKVQAVGTISITPYVIITGFLAKLLGFKWFVNITDDIRLPAETIRHNKGLKYRILYIYFKIYGFFAIKSLKFADLIIVGVLPDMLYEYGLDPKSEKVLLTTNGVDLSACKPILRRQGNGTFTITYIGTQTKGRDVGVLLSVASHLKERGLEFRLFLVGKVNEENRQWIERELESRDLTDEVTLTGRVKHARALSILDESDVCFSLLSPDVIGHQYIYPVKVFEYLAMGKVIIATNLGGTRQIITDRENGMLVFPNDARKIADIISEIYDNPGLRKRIEENAMESVKQYDWEKINAEVITEIERLLGNSVAY